MSIHEKINALDARLVNFARRIDMPFARFSIFLIYFWFGALKVFGLSPANPLVANLLEQTLPFITFDAFIFTFGLLEMLIGIIFLIPHLERLGIFVLVLHLITTIMPLIMLPEIAWSAPWVPTLEGQYIIKNILIIAVAIGIFAHLHSHRAEVQANNSNK